MHFASTLAVLPNLIVRGLAQKNVGSCPQSWWRLAEAVQGGLCLLLFLTSSANDPYALLQFTPTQWVPGMVLMPIWYCPMGRDLPSDLMSPTAWGTSVTLTQTPHTAWRVRLPGSAIMILNVDDFLDTKTCMVQALSTSSPAASLRGCRQRRRSCGTAISLRWRAACFTPPTSPHRWRIWRCRSWQTHTARPSIRGRWTAVTRFPWVRLTMRFGSTAKVLLKCKLKYYRISECACLPANWSKQRPCPAASPAVSAEILLAPRGYVSSQQFCLASSLLLKHWCRLLGNPNPRVEHQQHEWCSGGVSTSLHVSTHQCAEPWPPAKKRCQARTKLPMASSTQMFLAGEGGMRRWGLFTGSVTYVPSAGQLTGATSSEGST